MMSSTHRLKSGQWKALLVAATILYCGGAEAAPTTRQLVDQLLQPGVEEKVREQLSLRIYGRWNNAKHYLNHIAKNGSDEQVESVAQLVSGRVKAMDRCALNTAKEMVEAGYRQPVDAKFMTGTPPPPANKAALREYILKAAHKDIDATFVSKSRGAAEDYVERLAANWTRMTTGHDPRLANKALDYRQINRVLTNSEFTPFPHHADGSLSSNFRYKFPQIEHEAYTGPHGQRFLESKYGLSGKADIFRYGKDGKPSGLIQNQRPAQVIEHVNYGRYTRFERMKVMQAQYEKKFLQNLTGNVFKDSKASSKMLAEMIETEARIKGYNPNSHPLYKQAKALKEALKRGDDDAVRRITGEKNLTQALADFNRDADDVMAKMYQQNRSRMAEFADDSLGRPATQSSRLATAARALSLIGYGWAGADAYLKAKEGEEAKEVAKALTTALAADAAASTAGALGGGLVSGVGAAVVAAVVVHGGIEYTEEGIDNLLGGYKADATIKKVFLTPDAVKRFRTMTPGEIEKIIESEWEVQHQWGGLYAGKGGGAAKQEELKKEILQKALETQRKLNARALRAEIIGTMVREELESLVERHKNQELSAADYKLLSGILTGEDTGELPLSKAWRNVFGKGFDEIIEERLAKHHKSLQVMLNELEEEPERSGAWEWVFGQDVQDVKMAKDRAIDRFAQLHLNEQEFNKTLDDYQRHLEDLRRAVERGESEEILQELYAQLENDYKDLTAEYDTLASGAAVCMTDINKGFGTADDLSKYNEMKSKLARMMLHLEKKAIAAHSQHENLREFEKLLKTASLELREELTEKQFDPSNPYKIVSVTTQTETVEHQKKQYQKIVSIEGTALVARQSSKDHIIGGQAAIDLLIAKGYLKRIAGVGIVTQRSFDQFVDYSSGEEKTAERPDPNTIEACRAYEACRTKLGAARLAQLEKLRKEGLSKMSANDYWDSMCIAKRDECQKALTTSKSKKDKDWSWRDQFEIVPMTKEDAEMFSSGAGPRSSR